MQILVAYDSKPLGEQTSLARHAVCARARSGTGLARPRVPRRLLVAAACFLKAQPLREREAAC